ncbi:O-antigen ligase family protein [Campylobacter concisus]|uniref:O-antigen ligase family protein n=1 Tax=Campylobacter concisus TaxID=199 RepID=UPI000D3135FE|nr:O-antigen ligase family protein [Campylobacter concisus]
MMKFLTKYYSLLENLKYIFFTIYLFSLPVAKVASIQSISMSLFTLLVVATEYKKWSLKDLLKIKATLALLFIIALLAYISLFFTIDINETLKEVNKGVIKNVAFMIVLFYYFMNLGYEKIKIYIYIFFSSLLLHSVINIITWANVGFDFRYRTGGLLDGYIYDGGGERFGIWAVYAFGCAISLFTFKKNKAFAVLFLAISLVSIISNNTRATYIGVIFVLVAVFFIFIRSNKIRILSCALVTIFIFGFYEISHHISPDRYNLTLIPKYIELMKKSPKEMGTYSEMGLTESVPSRIASWKSVLIYRLHEPFVPTGYGRFLYGKTIRKLNSEQDVPFSDYSQVHNEFLGMFFSLGIFGLLAFIGIWISYLKTSIQVSKNNDTLLRVFGYTIFFGGFGFIASLLFGSFFGSSEAKLFYLTLGMALGIYYKEGSKNDDKYTRA